MNSRCGLSVSHGYRENATGMGIIFTLLVQRDVFVFVILVKEQLDRQCLENRYKGAHTILRNRCKVRVRF